MTPTSSCASCSPLGTGRLGRRAEPASWMVRRSCVGAAGLARNGGCCLGQPVLKEALFGLGLREVERAAVRVVGLTVPAGATQEAGTRGVEDQVDHGEDGRQPVG